MTNVRSAKILGRANHLLNDNLLARTSVSLFTLLNEFAQKVGAIHRHP